MQIFTVLAFICLAIGVAPSFSLPLISVRANPIKRSVDPPRRGGTFWTGNDSGSGNPDEAFSTEGFLHYQPQYPPEWLVTRTGDTTGPNRPSIGTEHKGVTHNGATIGNSQKDGYTPPNTPVATDEERIWDYIRNYGPSHPARTVSGRKIRTTPGAAHKPERGGSNW
ncbi:hypothetical protein F5148DRAFT_1366513 [Russula earlei]|uniref:Uncharacterized protein n=1 Tax=Russula earlei TaxID=71964 RepID=A0ACC0UFX1_9AGAM|nr:hypothetical protein F5148DRAFT_1366513 [Russula earlei]